SLGDGEKYCGVRSSVARQRNGVVDSREHVGPMNDAQTRSQSRGDLIVVPQGEVVMRRLTDLRSGARGRSVAGNKCVLIGISSGDSPIMRYASSQSELEPVSALTAGLHNPGRVVGICSPRIRTVQSKNRSR